MELFKAHFYGETVTQFSLRITTFGIAIESG